jgi:hypothetical protein
VSAETRSKGRLPRRHISTCLKLLASITRTPISDLQSPGSPSIGVYRCLPHRFSPRFFACFVRLRPLQSSRSAVSFVVSLICSQAQRGDRLTTCDALIRLDTSKRPAVLISSGCTFGELVTLNRWPTVTPLLAPLTSIRERSRGTKPAAMWWCRPFARRSTDVHLVA